MDLPQLPAASISPNYKIEDKGSWFISPSCRTWYLPSCIRRWFRPTWNALIYQLSKSCQTLRQSQAVDTASLPWDHFIGAKQCNKFYGRWPTSGWINIFIKPGYQWRNAFSTTTYQNRASVLVSAFAGQNSLWMLINTPSTKATVSLLWRCYVVKWESTLWIRLKVATA